MPGPPSFSVVIPTFGLSRRPWLRACIESVHRSIAVGSTAEVIVVVDGGNADDYASLTTLGHPVTVLTQAHSGPAAARNLGWQAACGDVIAFLDDDVIVEPEWLHDMRRHFTDHPDVAAVGGCIRPMNQRNSVSRMMTDFGHLDHRLTPQGWSLVTANCAVRRSSLAAIGGFDERYTTAAGEDTDLSVRLYAAGYTVQTMSRAIAHHHHPTTRRSMLTTARRYKAAEQLILTPRAPRPGGTVARLVGRLRNSKLSSSVTDRVEAVLYRAAGVRLLPTLYRVARQGPTAPAPHTAVAEALLEIEWQAEYQCS